MADGIGTEPRLRWSSGRGSWLLARWAERLAELRPPDPAAGRRNFERLREELADRSLSLDQGDWRFQPDPEDQGVEQGWQGVNWDDRAWATLRIDRHWEAQGFETLDGWAWYRRTVQLPDDWPAGSGFLNFTGVDDYYRVYVNGNCVGTGGDLDQRLTAFDERKSHDIGRWVRPGSSLQIAVAVYDWYGAGGIFRPASLSTKPLCEERRWLK